MKILRALAIVAALFGGAAHAQVNMAPLGPLGGGSGGGGGAPLNGFLSCTGGVCTALGSDGSTQFVTGNTNGAVEWIQDMGGTLGGGGNQVCRNAGQTGNVNCNITAQGNGVLNVSNGHGVLWQPLDPGGAVSNNGAVQETPSTSNGPIKVGNATYGINLDGGTNQIFETSGQPFFSNFPGFIAGNWYIPVYNGSFGVGAAPGSGSIRLFPAYINQRVTINSLGLRVEILFATGNVQAAIYANNPATGRPTGSALVSTASMSTTTAVVVNAAVSVQLNPGIYWFATNSDNATSAYATVGSTNPQMSYMIGSATQGNDLGGAGGGMVGVSTPSTFGTWGDLTAATFTEVTGAVTIPMVQFKIGSVP